MPPADDEATSYAHEIIHVEDKWAELLPTRIPLRYAFFRYCVLHPPPSSVHSYALHSYLGFCFKVRGVPGNTSAKAIKPASRASLRIKVTTSKGVALDGKVSAHFKDGVYYVQDIALQDEGLHTFHVWIESTVYTSVKPFVHELHVHQFMRLHDDAATLFGGPYGSLRKVVDPHLHGRHEEEKDVAWTDDFLDQCLAKSKTKLRTCDSKWWLRQFVDQGELQAKKQKRLRKRATSNDDDEEQKKLASRRRPRKQARPIRSGDKRDHENYFQGRQKEIKRQRTGQIRIFAHEPLHANETHIVFSKHELHAQLALYSKKQHSS
ncbi:Aste57867_18929 [Aphanomyces stellatus]|uniref:Aste57867_18929 protein n=1 Tax=Aphanomyces stellatus TaxID=120398 RepID=A0A485LFL0_9STRA|nr:hypothetical protein As57867_018865 [Aphanomyces stellatus]VFT95660.1 Aste57867_18929 [Aphanomyces stellatus]